MATKRRLTAEAFHPSEYIREELEARGWTEHDLVARMQIDNYASDLLSVEMYLTVGPDTDGLRIGADMDAKLCRAFGVSDGFFTRLEAAYLANQPRSRRKA